MLPKELRLTLKELFLQKKYLIIVALTGITGAACKGQIAIFIQRMIDASSSPEKLKSLAWIGLALSFGIAVSRYFHIYLMNMASEKVVQSLREKLQAKFMRLNLKFHNNYAAGSGGLLSRTFNDIRVIQDGLRLFADLFSAPLIFIFLIANLFFLDSQLTVYIFLIVPILILFLRKISKGIRKASLFGIEHLEKITSTIKESLDGVRTIQSFNLEKKMENRLHVLGSEFVRMRRSVHSRVELMGPITELIATFLVLAVIFYFSQRISMGVATAGTLIGFITALLQINEPIKKFQEAYVRIQETRVAAERVFHILDEDSEVHEATYPQPFPQFWDTIEYRNVSFGYGDNLLIKDFNLSVKKGQVVAFVGESGSGKSTLANLLARFYDPSNGSIFIGSQDVKEIQLADLRKNIGYVSQDVFLFADSIENNIKAGIEKETSVLDASQAAFAHDFILKQPYQYETRVGERGNLLSGGEKQRVGIARALYKDAPILILDEATSALDSVSEVQVQKGLERLMAGRTTFVIAHRLSTIQNADTILVLNKGVVVESGKHADLLNQNGKYKSLFEAQLR
ncbi:MAG: ABC transporter [Bdellovibrionales bacterium RIFCSPHIGHO2_01_FULL_40_29]|nr:MAG: ABC transporter [Bdellovibrionales bacterium RIFCSPHIGHO2_01_FULL_40_29]OFZ34956.1 MAG: ABC transporter [Bdellovibrionales bacterium RIFCSPHIGHO2_02_FULL_40_15]